MFSKKNKEVLSPIEPSVLFVTQWFDPEPAFRGLNFVKDIQSLGFSVEVVTGFPNYPEGKIYDGFRYKFFQKDEVDNVKITRLPLFASHDNSAIRRSLTYFSFFVSLFIYMLFVRKNSDIIYVYHPPITVGLAVALAQVFRRNPMVLEIQDMWPDTIASTGMLNSNMLLKVVSKMCSFLYRQAKHIIVQSNGFKDLLIKRNVPNEKISVLLGWADEEGLSQVVKSIENENLSNKDDFKIMFAGTIGGAQGLSSVLEAAKILSHEKRIKFYFIGGGKDKETLEAKAKSDRLENVKFLPRVGPLEIGSYLMAADVLLVHLKDDPLFKITIPSKTQNYLFAGKPILICVGGYADDLVLQAKGGITAQPENPIDIAKKVYQLFNMEKNELIKMGLSGRAYYDLKLSREHGLSSLKSIILTSLNKS